MRYNWHGILKGTAKLTEGKWVIPLLVIGVIISFLAIRVMDGYGIDIFSALSYLCFGWIVFFLGAILLGIIVGQFKD
ncbi:MAG: hypothetical protein V5A66_01695 [Candidatus Thermoplasmatota archaeon]